ncbi:hypothetical protein SLS62_007830 [Diatrype stigma]|uniref:Uncharacterized protein n=1 Tax=Diatrype stigma TaxID=117547 RepID=A0AAN9YN35_9PEZI
MYHMTKMSPAINHGSSTPPSKNGIFLFEFSHFNCFRYNHRTGSLESCRGFDAVDFYDSKNDSRKIKGASASDDEANKHPHPHPHHDHHHHLCQHIPGHSGGGSSSSKMTTIHENSTKQDHQPQQPSLSPPTLEPLLQSAAEWHFREYHSNKALLGHRVEVRQAHVVWKDAGAGAIELLDVPLPVAEWQLDLVRARGYVDHISIGYATHERETSA